MSRCRSSAACVVCLASFGVVAAAAVNLEWRPATAGVLVGDAVRLELWAVATNPAIPESVAAADVIVRWDPGPLHFTGIDPTGATAWLFCGFGSDPWGLNELDPPQDGDLLLSALAPLGQPIAVSAAGILVTTFEFAAQSPSSGSQVELVGTLAGSPPPRTVVFDGHVPNLNIVGSLGQAVITISDTLCVGDIDGDRVVGLSDLTVVLIHFGTPSGMGLAEGDLDGDGCVNLTDLATLLAHFGEQCE